MSDDRPLDGTLGTLPDRETRERRALESVAQARQLLGPVNRAPATEHDRRLAAAIEALTTPAERGGTPPAWPEVDEG